MEVTVLVAVIGAIAGVIGGAITHFTTMRTTDRTSETEVSIKRLEADNAIQLARDKQQHEIDFSQQTFVREVIQATLERSPEPDDQIRNLRAYARIGLIGEPYAEKILAMRAEDLPQTTALERVLTDPSVELPAGHLDRLVAAVHATGLVRQGGGQAFGTGFLAGDGLLLTAFHVLPSREAATGGALLMDYETDADQGAKPRQSFALEPQRLYVALERPGVTAVAVAAASADGTALRSYGWIAGSARRPEQGARVNLIHHPEGRPKQIGMREARVLSGNDQHLYYLAASRPGSSGAPVLDDNFDVVAMHYAKTRLGRTQQADALQGITWPAIVGALTAAAEHFPEEQAALLRGVR